MAVLGLWKLFAHSGLINLNFSDLKNLMERSGGGWLARRAFRARLVV